MGWILNWTDIWQKDESKTKALNIWISDVRSIQTEKKKQCNHTLIVFDSDMSDKAVELEGEGEDVVVVRGVPHHEGTVRLRGQNTFRGLPGQRAPVPTSLNKNLLLT